MMKKFLLAALMLAVPVAAQAPELFVSGDSTVERVGLPDESPARCPRGRVSPGPEQRNARIGFYNHVDRKRHGIQHGVYRDGADRWYFHTYRNGVQHGEAGEFRNGLRHGYFRTWVHGEPGECTNYNDGEVVE